jgi:hypothetical protein
VVEEHAQPVGTVTLWDVPPNRWWPTIPLVYALGGVGLTVLLGVMTRLDPWSLLALLFVAYGLGTVSAARTRVRLTPEGVEVRRLRTTLLRYGDIASVEVAPEWDGGRSVWIRLRASQPQSEPEVLTPPPEWWHEPGRTLTDVVTSIQARVDAVRTPGRGTDDPS